MSLRIFGDKTSCVTLVVCVIEIVFMGGIQYGWNGLIPVWMADKIYDDKCVSNSSTSRSFIPQENNSSVTVSVEKRDCSGQSTMFSNAFIIASSLQFLVTLPCGLVFDKYGLRVSKLCNAVFFVSACFAMALVSPDRPFMMFVGGVLYSFSGALIIFTNFSIGQLFPKYEALVVSIFSGGFDSSSVVFQLIALGHKGGLPTMASFIILAVAGLLVMVFVAFILFPKKSFSGNADDANTNNNAEGAGASPEEITMMEQNGADREEDGDVQNRAPADEADVMQPNSSLSVMPHLKTRFFWLQVMWFSCILLRFNYFLSALQQQLKYRFPKDDGSITNRVLTALGFFLFCGIFVAPIAGTMTEFLKRKLPSGSSATLSSTLRPIAIGEIFCSSFSLLLTILSYVSGEPVFYFLFVLEVLLRGFLFSLNASYFLTAFPIEIFGTLFGIEFILGGIFSSIQFALLQFDFIVSNGIVLLIVIVSYVQPLSILVGPRACCQH